MSVLTVGLFATCLAAVLTLLVVSGRRSPQPPPGSVDGIATFEVGSSEHTDGQVLYDETPPVGGDHHPRWQNCGFYSAPVASEHAVHSLEHGVIWITYRPGRSTVDMDVLRRLASESPRVLVSPWDESLPAPVVASVWGHQLQLASATDPALADFVDRYEDGRHAPEPGAPCHGGEGTPE